MRRSQNTSLLDSWLLKILSSFQTKVSKGEQHSTGSKHLCMPLKRHTTNEQKNSFQCSNMETLVEKEYSFFQQLIGLSGLPTLLGFSV
uniref:Uncharacterized protein n=1 Tax=Cucumis melo TaxID=3656 RepID=A0A9I9E8P7_CUCME